MPPQYPNNNLVHDNSMNFPVLPGVRVRTGYEYTSPQAQQYYQQPWYRKLSPKTYIDMLNPAQKMRDIWTGARLMFQGKTTPEAIRQDAIERSKAQYGHLYTPGAGENLVESNATLPAPATRGRRRSRGDEYNIQKALAAAGLNVDTRMEMSRQRVKEKEYADLMKRVSGASGGEISQLPPELRRVLVNAAQGMAPSGFNITYGGPNSGRIGASAGTLANMPSPGMSATDAETARNRDKLYDAMFTYLMARDRVAGGGTGSPAINAAAGKTVLPPRASALYDALVRSGATRDRGWENKQNFKETAKGGAEKLVKKEENKKNTKESAIQSLVKFAGVGSPSYETALLSGMLNTISPSAATMPLIPGTNLTLPFVGGLVNEFFPAIQPSAALNTAYNAGVRAATAANVAQTTQALANAGVPGMIAAPLGSIGGMIGSLPQTLGYAGMQVVRNPILSAALLGATLLGANLLSDVTGAERV